ncbi:MAG: hypothetical protein R3E89_04050 [Thiolinea sp.]
MVARRSEPGVDGLVWQVDEFLNTLPNSAAGDGRSSGDIALSLKRMGISWGRCTIGQRAARCWRRQA